MNPSTVPRVTFLGLVGLAVVATLFQAPDSSYTYRIWVALLLAYGGYEIVSTLRGSRRALDEVNAMFRQAEKVRRTDPAAAQRLVDGYFQEAARRGAQERATLRARAVTEIAAAKRLAALLRDDVKGLRDIRERFLSQLEPSKRATEEALNEQREHEIQSELGALEGTIRRLRA